MGKKARTPWSIFISLHGDQCCFFSSQQNRSNLLSCRRLWQRHSDILPCILTLKRTTSTPSRILTARKQMSFLHHLGGNQARGLNAMSHLMIPVLFASWHLIGWAYQRAHTYARTCSNLR